MHQTSQHAVHDITGGAEFPNALVTSAKTTNFCDAWLRHWLDWVLTLNFSFFFQVMVAAKPEPVTEPALETFGPLPY